MQRRGRLQKPRIEWFIHSFLQAVMREEVDLGRLYFEYRKYVFNGSEPEKAESQLSLLSKYADIYRRLVDGEGEDSVANFGRRIAAFEVTTIHPLALLIGSSDVEEAEKCLMYDLLVSYVVRRSICGLTQKNYNNVFVSLLRNVAKSELSAGRLHDLLMSLKGEGSRWPRDEEFEASLRNADIYPGRLDPKKMQAVLSELEYELRNSAKIEDMSKSDFTHLDIDHILPQSWFLHWPLPNDESVEKGEISSIQLKQLIGTPLVERERSIIAREEVVKTLGNLTLLNLSVNRSAQNKSFINKKKLLIENTNLRLNIPLIGLGSWDEETIKKRGEQLAKSALRIWPGEKAEQGA